MTLATPALHDRNGFSLIELMIVIAIIGILVAVALPQFMSVTDDAKKTKARQDCDVICQSIQKYNALEGCQVESIMDLKGKYLAGVDTLRDPWGNAYQIDPYAGIVYSKGPDGQDRRDDASHRFNNDNIKLSYIGALTVVKAQLEVNPAGESDPARAFDVLHLLFNKRVRLAATAIDLKASGASEAAGPSEIEAAGKAADAACAAGKAFRWCEGTKGRYVSADDLFKDFTTDGASSPAAAVSLTYGAWDDPASGYTGAAAAGTVYHTADSREIVIALPAGTSGSLVPGTHFVNLTGNRKNAPVANPLFKEFDGTTGGEMAGTPVKIETHD